MDSAVVATLTVEFNRALHGGKVRDGERTLTDLADAFYLDAPVHARIDLLQIAGLAVLRDKLFREGADGDGAPVAAGRSGVEVSARIALLLQRVSPDPWDPTPAGIYLDRLPVEFPRAPEQPLARSRRSWRLNGPRPAGGGWPSRRSTAVAGIRPRPTPAAPARSTVPPIPWP